MNTFLESTHSFVSYPIQFDSIRIFLLLFSSILLGYTLQPVPKWLNTLFDSNNFFKFAIIFTAGFIAIYPAKQKQLLYVVIFSIIVLTHKSI